jgi:hypothetical protein
MRPILTIITATILLIGCSSKDKGKSRQNAKSISILDSTNESQAGDLEIDSNCDSLKFPDFKNNLQEIEVKISPEFESEIYEIAKRFIEEKCKEDTLYCGDIYLRHREHFLSTQGQELFSFGYAYKNAGMEQQSASFFVFGIKKEGKTVFYDIASDLVGEIKLKLKGVEKIKSATVIWGELYPYFDVDYGKFKLTINNTKKNYEFQCHLEEN